MTIPKLRASALIGSHDVLLMTLDTLRYDVAAQCLERGQLPNLSKVLPATGWERRHSPGTFTYAAHHAFFAGFLPTPASPQQRPHPRLFAARFAGSETTDPDTWVFDAPDLIAGLRQIGYVTLCIGGVGFFNKQTAIGQVLPERFDESHWSPQTGVTCPDSTRHQVELALALLSQRSPGQRVMLFINVSAIHQPNRHYVPGATRDDLQTHAAALRYVDSQLGALFDGLRARQRPWLCIVCADHGTAYGEDGYHGHRLAHEVVTTVPYAEFLLP